jgi:hypothetical protein
LPAAAPLALAVAAQLALAGPGPDAWARSELGAVRGVTVGPIENAYHPGVGYGSAAYRRTLGEARAMGATWVAVTPFGRVADLAGRGVDLSFEAPFEDNRRAIARAVAMAHARGLRVLLVPHLWVESGEWRALIDPKTDEGWARWAESYTRFVVAWATVAEETRADMFSVGVELRSWVTTARAPSFAPVVAAVRRVYGGIVTYSANWDDVADTSILGELDVIGVNAFYPLADEDGAGEEKLREGGARVRAKVRALAEAWQRPVVFTEIGYTTRRDPAIKPWLWPDAMSKVTIDEAAQAAAYRALVAPLLDEPDFAGFFVWRVYADPDDASQEAPWGFSPRGKLAELVVRDAFAAHWASDPWWTRGVGAAAGVPGVYP